MKNQIAISLIGALIMLISSNLIANNIQVGNVSLTGENANDKYVLVQFDLSWENSWRTSSAPNNWDAAWIFVKYRITTANGGDDLWKHAWLNIAGHSSGTGTNATFDIGLVTPDNVFNPTANPGLGVFVYRASDGEGDFSITGAQLRWNYGANGLADHAKVDVKVFAIEMVYVPEGAFYIGSGGDETETDTFYRYVVMQDAFHVSSEDAINVGSTTGYLYYRADADGGDRGGPVPAEFPKGYAAFYCMKYPISQQQYVDFLITLTRTQQNNRTRTSLPPGTTFVENRFVMRNTSTPLFRNGISCDVTIPANDPITFYCDLNNNEIGGEADDGQWLTSNFLSWMDGCAYADWAGLRPMTELEYEKAGRGTAEPMSGEYAWGNTTITAATNIINPRTANESTTTSGANTAYGNHASELGPLRVGIFATAGTTREQSGASYYGIMELSGNLEEQTVTVGHPTGRAFTGVHGDGALSADGHANQTAWPGLHYGQVVIGRGAGIRGGNWHNSAAFLRISDRHYAASQPMAENRSNYKGFRAVRSQPFVCGHQIADTDGNYYNTVQIDNQCWMKENLKTTHYSNGTPIEYPTNSIEWQNNTTGAYAWYNNDIGWKDIYGALYNWHAVNNANGLCPTGWRVPTHAEYEALANHLGGAAIAGGKMKSTRTEPDLHPRWKSDNTGASNESGWSGFPGGERIQYGGFSLIGDYGFWWSSNESSDTEAWNRTLYYNSPNVGRTPNVNKGKGLSVRCLRE